MYSSRSIVAVPPGFTIREQLQDRQMTQKEFAARMGFSEKHVSKLINGEVELTPETAVKLEYVLGIPAKYWNRLEAAYREDLERARQENAMETEEELVTQFQYPELERRGLVPSCETVQEKVIALRKYYGVVSLSLVWNPQVHLREKVLLAPDHWE